MTKNQYDILSAVSVATAVRGTAVVTELQARFPRVSILMNIRRLWDFGWVEPALYKPVLWSPPGVWEVTRYDNAHMRKHKEWPWRVTEKGKAVLVQAGIAGYENVTGVMVGAVRL